MCTCISPQHSILSTSTTFWFVYSAAYSRNRMHWGAWELQRHPVFSWRHFSSECSKRLQRQELKFSGRRIFLQRGIDLGKSPPLTPLAAPNPFGCTGALTGQELDAAISGVRDEGCGCADGAVHGRLESAR